MFAPSRTLLRYLRLSERNCRASFDVRSFSASPIAPSGHSKWATIKHDKARNDAHKNRERTVIAKEIVNAVRFFGPDAKTNNRLTAAVAGAKRAGMSKGSIETAILRGQGKSASGAALETMTLEAVLPPVGFIVDCETDSKGRTLQELRSILTKNKAQSSPTQYLFDKRGRIVFGKKDGVLEVDEIMEAALEAGAIDLEPDLDDPGRVVVFTEPTAIADVEKLSDDGDIERHSTDIIWSPKEDTMVDVDDSLLSDIDKLVNELEDYNGVQGVYTNLTPMPPAS